MTQDVLERILDIRGVTRAALVDGVGDPVLAAPQEDAQSEGEGLDGGLVTSSLATSRVLADLLGEGDLCQTMIDFENGPVLLAPLSSVASRTDSRTDMPSRSQHGVSASKPTVTNSHVVVLTLEAANALGRVRLGLRKLLPELAGAFETP